MGAIRSCLPDKKTLKDRIDLVLWFTSYFIFLLIGGILITLIEQDHDKTLKNEKRLNLLTAMKKYNISINDTMILDLFTLAVDAANVGGLNLNNLEEEVQSSWAFGAGLFFCSTIVTTIGFGNISPKTVGGRWFVIFFAFAGIPLTGIVLGKLGHRLTKLIKKMDTTLVKPVGKILGTLHVEKKLKSYIRTIQIIIVFFLFIMFFWIIPALIMTQTEGWDINTAIYFCFITISTIGLGDIVPGVSETTLSLNNIDLNGIAHQVSTICYFVLGLAALSIILNLTKSLFDSFAASAMETAGNISDKGKMFAGNMAGSMKGKIYRGKNGKDAQHPDSGCFTDVDTPLKGLELIAEEPEQQLNPNVENEDTNLSIDAMLNPATNEEKFNSAFDEDNELVLEAGELQKKDEKQQKREDTMPDVVVE